MRRPLAMFLAALPLFLAAVFAATLPGTSTPASAATVTATTTCNNVLLVPDSATNHSFEACVTVSFEADRWRPGYSYAAASATVRRDVTPAGAADVQITLSDVIVYHGWNNANTAWEVAARLGYPVVGMNSVSQTQWTRSSYSNTAGHAFRGCIRWQAVAIGEQITCTKPAPLS